MASTSPLTVVGRLPVRSNFTYSIMIVGTGTFHEPKSMLHKVEKALMLETDVSEIANEMILADIMTEIVDSLTVCQSIEM